MRRYWKNFVDWLFKKNKTMLTDSEISTFTNQLQHIQTKLLQLSNRNRDNLELQRAYNSMHTALGPALSFLSVIEQVQLETVEKEKTIKDFKKFDQK